MFGEKQAGRDRELEGSLSGSEVRQIILTGVTLGKGWRRKPAMCPSQRTRIWERMVGPDGGEAGGQSQELIFVL